jgi:hypothetical protein
MKNKRGRGLSAASFALHLYAGTEFWAGSRRLVLERVNDRDVGFNLDGLAVQNGGTVAPLADGVGSGS